jgi:DNA-binding GntR family transcriptional regulator
MCIHTYVLFGMKDVNSNIAYEYVRKRIVSGEYPPGRALMTKDLASDIGISRTPVRDALRQLETDGLVIIRPRLGASVKMMDLKEYRDLCGLRLALESYAAGFAAQNRTDAELREIRFALESMRKLTEQIIEADDEASVLRELVREDVRFHIAVMTAAKNELIKKEILRLHIVNRVVSSPAPGEAGSHVTKAERNERRRKVMMSHDEIYQAVERGDSVAAKSAMEFHIQDIIDNNLALMARSENRLGARELTEEELSYSA